VEMYLQFGHGMMEHCRALLDGWGEGCVILSPRDFTHSQMKGFASDVLRMNGRTLLDSQLYAPRATHHKLHQHAYWPNDYDTNMMLGGPGLRRMLVELRNLNEETQTWAYIIPGLQCADASDLWFAHMESTLHEADKLVDDRPKLATICLSPEVVINEQAVETIIERAEVWKVDGYYVVAEHPSEYLVRDPRWLVNFLGLCAGLKLHDRTVIAGYCSHQMLSLAAANVDAIAAGTFMNLRSFSTVRFNEPEPTVNRHSVWFYCPQALSEYQVRYLDIAQQQGILQELKPLEIMNCDYANVLFAGATPTATGYDQRASFRHYLQCLHNQVDYAGKLTFQTTFDALMSDLQTAETLIRNVCHPHGVRGSDRDFLEIVDVNRSALTLLDNTRGFLLGHQWG
jgi:hypothetical protein